MALVEMQDGKVLEEAKIKTPHDKQAQEKFLGFVQTNVHTWQKNYSIQCVGIGSPGPLDPETGRILRSANLVSLSDFSVVPPLEEKLKVPVYLENDANCAAFGVHAYGAAKNLKNFIMLTLGTGIGGAAFIKGELYRGSRFNAAEFGHIVLYPEGRACGCGFRGCLEQYASASAIKRRATELFKQEISNKDLFKKAQDSKSEEYTFLEKVSVDLALGIVSLVNVFDPQKVVLGGGIFTKGGEPLLSLTQEKIRKWAFSVAKEVKLEASLLGGAAGVLGAAAMAKSEFLKRV